MIDIKDILFILDRAHGKNVSGKQSPDGSFKEWEYSENVVSKLGKEMDKLGIPNDRTVIEDYEVGLIERIRRGNELAKKTNLPIFISFHNNAGGGRGNELFLKKKPSKLEIEIGNIVANRIKNDFSDIPWRINTPDKLYKEGKFLVLYGSKKYNVYPQYNGMLIEFLFMDNENDLNMLKDSKVFDKYIDTLLYSVVEICHFYKIGNFKL